MGDSKGDGQSGWMEMIVVENVWVLIFWLSSCYGPDCPIENWIAVEQPSQAVCEMTLTIKKKEWNETLKSVPKIEPRGICLWGILTNLEPPDE